VLNNGHSEVVLFFFFLITGSKIEDPSLKKVCLLQKDNLFLLATCHFFHGGSSPSKGGTECREGQVSLNVCYPGKAPV